MTPWMALCSIWKMKRSRKNNSPVVVSMADLAAAMVGALLDLPLLPIIREGGGRRGRGLWWMWRSPDFGEA